MIPQEYIKWQSPRNKKDTDFIEGQISIINRWLGDGIDGEPWGAINSYLPDRPSQYKNYNIVAKYDESEDIQGIRVHFKGKFSSTIKNLAKQVVFKISDSDENVLIANY